MFRSLSVVASRQVKARVASSFKIQAQPRRCMSMEGTRFQKEEQAAERDFINKSERELLQNLVALQRKKSDPTGSVANEQIKNILKQHNVQVKDELIADLVAWKNQV